MKVLMGEWKPDEGVNVKEVEVRKLCQKTYSFAEEHITPLAESGQVGISTSCWAGCGGSGKDGDEVCGEGLHVDML